MKRYLTNLIIIAIIVVGGIKIFNAFSSVEEGNDAISNNDQLPVGNGKSGNQTQGSAKTKQARLAMQASKRDSEKQPREMRQVLADDLETRFLNAGSSGHELENIKAEMIARLNGGDSATLQWIQQALGSSEPKIQRHLIDVLGQVRSGEVMEAMLQFAQTADPEKGEPRMAALRAIAEVKHLQKAGKRSRDEASAILEQYLDSASSDTETLYAVANGISKLGRPGGISKLIGLLETKPETAGIISDALSKARSPTAISQLKERLQQDPELSHPASNMIGSVLGAIGTPQAVNAILDLASNAQDEETQQKIFSWLSQTNDEGSVQLLLSAQDEYRFADPQFGLRLQELGQQN